MGFQIRQVFIVTEIKLKIVGNYHCWGRNNLAYDSSNNSIALVYIINKQEQHVFNINGGVKLKIKPR